MSVLDRIILEDLVVDCVVGVLEREQHTPQPVHIDLELQLDLTEAGETGGLGASVDYASIADQVRFIAQHGRFRLIESMALACLRAILARPSPTEDRAAIVEARIRIRKPTILGGNPVPGVVLHRTVPTGVTAIVQGGAVVSTLVEVPGSVARRVVLAPGTPWTPGPRVAALVLSGDVGRGAATLGPGGRLPRPVGPIATAGGATLLVVGQP